MRISSRSSRSPPLLFTRDPQPRFFEQKAYLDAKYPQTEAFGSVGYNIGGGRTPMRRFQKRVRTFLDRHAKFAVRWYFKMIS